MIQANQHMGLIQNRYLHPTDEEKNYRQHNIRLKLLEIFLSTKKNYVKSLD